MQLVSFYPLLFEFDIYWDTLRIIIQTVVTIVMLYYITVNQDIN